MHARSSKRFHFLTKLLVIPSTCFSIGLSLILMATYSHEQSNLTFLEKAILGVATAPGIIALTISIPIQVVIQSIGELLGIVPRAAIGSTELPWEAVIVIAALTVTGIMMIAPALLRLVLRRNKFLSEQQY